MIILNGGSSSGKSSLARCLQDVLPTPWLTTGVDALIEQLPPRLRPGDPVAGGGGEPAADALITFAEDGSIDVSPAFRLLEEAWMAGVAATARAGAPVILDDVFLGGAASQQSWRKHVGGLDVLWVGVRCDAAVAAQREAARGDRAVGMAASQAEVVHRGVTYDLEVDTTHTDPLACARTIAMRLG